MANGEFLFKCDEDDSSFSVKKDIIFCNKCSSQIIDLTNMSHKEIQDVISSHPDGFCGQFYEEQLLLTNSRNLVFSSLLAMTASFSSYDLNAQVIIPKRETVSVENQICPKSESPEMVDNYITDEQLVTEQLQNKKIKTRRSKFKLIKHFPFIVRRRYIRGRF